MMLQKIDAFRRLRDEHGLSSEKNPRRCKARRRFI